MDIRPLALAASVALPGGGAQAADADPGNGSAAQQIARAASQSSAPGPAEYFTGHVQVTAVWPATDAINASGGIVAFEPGARSAWHTHPRGQRLLVLSGVGLTQQWGRPVEVIRAGDAIWCPPGVKHWHGATPTDPMTHLAVTGTADGKNVTWLEKVDDAQYQAP